MRKFFINTIYFSVLILPLTLVASSGGPPDELAGNPPNRANCTQCHSSFGVNTGQGSLDLIDFPEEYTTGETYQITINLEDPNASRWGFQLTAIDDGNDRAGDIDVVNGNQTRLSDRNGRPQYLMQRAAGTFRNQRNQAQWVFDWTAPDDDIGEIRFYVAGNAANNNGNTAGDRIYTSNFSMAAAEPPPPPPPDPDMFELTLNEGWNFISSNVMPDSGEIEFIFADLIEDSSLVIIRNSAGEFFDPMNEEGELAIWDSDQAYQVKMNREATVEFSGSFIDSSTVYLLSEGWNWLPYPRKDDSHPVEAFADYVESIEFVKDNSGIFWTATDSLNYMPIITPGSAVMVKANAETEFFWADPVGEMDDPIELLPAQHFATPMNTGKSMNLLVTMWEEIELGDGDELSLMNSEGQVFGSAVIQSEFQPIILWGDDDTTPGDIDGFLADSTLNFVYYNSQLDEEIVTYTITEEGDSTLIYADNSFIRITVGIIVDGISIGEDATRNESFEIVSLYPNPFNQSTELEFKLISSAEVIVSLWNIEGRLLTVLRNGHYRAGLHTVTINAKNYTAGMYFVKVQSGTSHKIKSLILLP